MIFGLHTAYNKHEMIKIGNQIREKSQVHRKCSNNFAADCIKSEVILEVTTVIGESLVNDHRISRAVTTFKRIS